MKNNFITIRSYHILCLFTFMFLIGCRREVDIRENTNYMQTTTVDLKTNSTAVTLSLATQIAQKFLQQKHPNINVSVKNAETIIKNGIPYIHIINTNNNMGFALIAADSLYVPILAYDSIGNFNKNNLNTGLVLWFNKHGKELDFIRNTKNAYTDSIAKQNKLIWVAINKKLNTNQPLLAGKTIESNNTAGYTVFKLAPPDPVITGSGADITYNSVGPLCTTYWDQSNPWNQYCPTGSRYGGYAGHTPAGCVPVAMAQIMRFWQYPTNYNWNTMVNFIDANNSATWPVNNPGGFTESARLIHDIGTTTGPVFISAFNGGLLPTSQFVYYDDGGSSADDTYCPYVFGNFGYSSASRTETISDQILWGQKSGTIYSGLLVDEIMNNQRPCLVSGHNDMNTFLGLIYWPAGEGHTWVSDGCQQMVLHPYNILTYYDNNGNVVNTVNMYSPSYVALGMLHMNWGWGASLLGGSNNNGWYNYSINYTAAPDGHDYNYFQTIIYNIHP